MRKATLRIGKFSGSLQASLEGFPLMLSCKQSAT
ncbi:hypothetical protein PSPHG_CDS_0015 [Pseudomonas phage Psxphi15]